MSIPVARPRLPTTDEIAPYLRRIDASRWYSNGGPLVQEFEERLANHFGAGNVRTATVANATIGLTVALLAHDLPHGDIAVCVGRDIGSTLRVKTAGIEGDERVIGEGATELIQQFIIESHETQTFPEALEGYQPGEPSNLILYRGSGHTNGEAASPHLCPIGALRQCKSLSGYRRYLSLKSLTQRWAVQCIKPITKRRRQSDHRLREQQHVWEPTSISWDKIFVAQILPCV
jgi:hypothetical protein